MMTKSAVVHARIDADLKAGAESILKQIGVSSAEAIRMFYRQIEMKHGIPFDVKIPNKLTRETLSKSENGNDIFHAKDADDLFQQLEI